MHERSLTSSSIVVGWLQNLKKFVVDILCVRMQ